MTNEKGSIVIPADTVIPAPHQVRGKLQQGSKKMDLFSQESCQFISLWIPAFAGMTA